jgi:hypothetical protein
MAMCLSEDKIVISVALTGNMKEHFLMRQNEWGLKRTELIRKFIAEDMENCKDKERPQINYYSTETTLPSSNPLPKIMTSKKPAEMAGMMGTNAEMKRLIESTGGNPRKALKKVIRVEA